MVGWDLFPSLRVRASLGAARSPRRAVDHFAAPPFPVRAGGTRGRRGDWRARPALGRRAHGMGSLGCAAAQHVGRDRRRLGRRSRLRQPSSGHPAGVGRRPARTRERHEARPRLVRLVGPRRHAGRTARWCHPAGGADRDVVRGSVPHTCAGHYGHLARPVRTRRAAGRAARIDPAAATGMHGGRIMWHERGSAGASWRAARRRPAHRRGRIDDVRRCPDVRVARRVVRAAARLPLRPDRPPSRGRAAAHQAVRAVHGDGLRVG